MTQLHHLTAAARPAVDRLAARARDLDRKWLMLSGAALALAAVAAGGAVAVRKARRKADADGDAAGGATVVRSVTVNRPREELYAFWRDFSNLAQFMENIESITVEDDRRSHWVVKAPAGRRVEWDAIVTGEEPGRRIAWESAPGADIKNGGSVEFKDAPGGRGTEVRAEINYDPPLGPLGQFAAKLFQKEPGIQARRDLRRFKQLMETGEIATTEGAAAAPAARKIKQ